MKDITYYKNLFDEYIATSQKQESFPRILSSDDKNFLKEYYGVASYKEACYLIHGTKKYCKVCNKPGKFINGSIGYKDFCGDLKCKHTLISFSQKKYNSKRIEVICNCCKQLILVSPQKYRKNNKFYCKTCKKCTYCNTYTTKETKLNLSRKSGTFCSKKCYQLYREDLYKSRWRTEKLYKIKIPYRQKIFLCKECNIEYSLHHIQNQKYKLINESYCKKHRKVCPICKKRFGRQGKTCSIECSKKLMEETTLKNYGVKHNFMLEKMRANSKLYWMNQGYSEKDAILKVKSCQRVDMTKWTSNKKLKRGLKYLNLKHIDELNKYTKEYLEKISQFKIETSTLSEIIAQIYNPLIIDSLGYEYLKVLIQEYIPLNTFNISISKKFKGKFGYKTYTHKKELMQSSYEYTFYTILRDNNIEYKHNKQYPNQDKTKYRYDFYIPILDEYIEIAGMCGYKNYTKSLNKKINFLRKTNLKYIILYTVDDIYTYSEQLVKNILYENKKY